MSYSKALKAGILLLCMAALSFGVTTTQTATSMTVSVDASGAYSVTAPHPSTAGQTWTFSGNLGKTLSDINQISGTDNIGSYVGISFSLTGTGPLLAAIKLYQKPVALFSMTTQEQMASLGVNFPEFTTMPSLPYVFGQNNSTFAPPKFALSSITGKSQIIYFDASSNAFAFSAADHFWETVNTYSATSIRSGLETWVTPLPSGWTNLAILAVGNGVNKTCDLWGDAIMSLYGKTRCATDVDIPAKTLGYWTDNTAYYYYKYETALGYDGTLLAVKKHWCDTLKIKIGYIQLDSWWYKKTCNATWQNSGGVYEYVAHPSVFPKGLKSVYDSCKVPLFTHSRWYETCSKIATKYGLSGGLPIKYDAWKEILYPCADSGVITYEQDWLDASSLVAKHIGDLDSAMGNMAKVCKEKNMTMQYCMETPMYFLQAAKYPNLTSSRVTNDGFTLARVNDYFFNSRFAWSTGMLPWSDPFASSGTTGQALTLVDAVSGGLTGPSEQMGKETVPVILSLTRRDGVLIKPDIVSCPTEATYVNFGKSAAAGCVVRSWTDHGSNYKTYYVYSSPGTYSFDPAAEGMNTTNGVFAYNWTGKTGSLIASGSSLSGTAATNSFVYFVVAPVGPSGIAFLGDSAKYISCGKQRISALVHGANQVQATVDLEPEETAPVKLIGYATTQPTVKVSSNATGTISYDATSKMFKATITPVTASRAALIHITVAIGQNPVVSEKQQHAILSAAAIRVTQENRVITIDMGSRADFSVRLVSLNGKTCYANRCDGRQYLVIPSAALKTGAYVLQVNAGKDSFVRKLVVR